MTKNAISRQPSAISGRGSSIRHRFAFTLIELLVVVGVVALLISVLVVAGGGIMDDAKTKETKVVMQLLDMAAEEFKQDAPLKGVPGYHGRYGDYPCDELEVFYEHGGIPGTGDPGVVAARSGATINAASVAALGDIKHRDVAAMALAIRLYSEEGTAILDKIGNRYRKVPANTDFFDRNGDGNLDIDDEPLVYYVDAWGNPFEYFALCPSPPGGLQPAPTDNAAGDRLKTAQRFVHANHNKALFVSYGPDGTDQLQDLKDRDTGFKSPLVEDFSDADPVGVGGVIDNPLNADTVFIDDEVGKKVRVE